MSSTGNGHVVILVFLGALVGFVHGLCDRGNQTQRAPSSTPKDYIQRALDQTNKHRQAHGVAPLSIDEDLCQVSQAWANHLAKTGERKHNKAQTCGENMAIGDASYDVVHLVNLWYGEEKNYDYSKPGFSMKTGHFTALVWKSTNLMCISMAKDVNGTNYVVANYYPPGNWDYEYTKNVFPKIGGGGKGGDASARTGNDTGNGMSGGSGGSSSGHKMTLSLSTLVMATGIIVVFNWWI